LNTVRTLGALAFGTALALSAPASAGSDKPLDHFWADEATTVFFNARADNSQPVSLTLPPILMATGHRGSIVDARVGPAYWEMDCVSGRARITENNGPASWVLLAHGSLGRQALEIVCTSATVFDLQTMRTVSLKQ
jgi:hypothetical protein